MKVLNLKNSTRLAVAALLLLLAGAVSAQNPDISYPIAELGNCADRNACKQYCAQPRLSCVNFAEKQGMVSAEEAASMRAAIAEAQATERASRTPALERDDLVGSIRAQNRPQATRSSPTRPTPPRPQPPRPRADDHGPGINEEKARLAIEKFGGPGGCTDMESCGTFCDAPGNMQVCMTYAKEHGLMDGKDLEKMEKMMMAVGPGGCRGRECERYCDEPGHEDECLAFAKENGLISEEDFKEIERMMSLVGPGGCRGRECEQYCEVPGHEEECFAFAKDNGLIPQEEIEMIEKMMNREGPGGCRGRECESYCDDPDHSDECTEFAYKEGMMSEEEYRRAMQPGPGGCRGPACERYCNTPEHQEECGRFYGFDAGEEGGGRGGREPMDIFDDARFDSDAMKRLRAGGTDRPEGPMDDFVGPGGCNGRECEKYCRDNEAECRAFFEKQNTEERYENEGGEYPPPPRNGFPPARRDSQEESERSREHLKYQRDDEQLRREREQVFMHIRRDGDRSEGGEEREIGETGFRPGPFPPGDFRPGPDGVPPGDPANLMAPPFGGGEFNPPPFHDGEFPDRASFDESYDGRDGMPTDGMQNGMDVMIPPHDTRPAPTEAYGGGGMTGSDGTRSTMPPMGSDDGSFDQQMPPPPPAEGERAAPAEGVQSRRPLRSFVATVISAFRDLLQ